MSSQSDRLLSNEERAELEKRKFEMTTQKKSKQACSLSDLKKELGLPVKSEKK
jgi:hypothetical protein